MKITSPSWIIYSFLLDELNSIDWLLKANDKFFWNNFYFILVKEFWYGKKVLEIFWRISLNIILWILLLILTPFVIWILLWILPWNTNTSKP